MTESLMEKEIAPIAVAADDMSHFLREIREFPLLSRDEELALAKKCACGDAEAIRSMVHSNLRLVVSVAREYANRGVPLLDLIQEGCIGLLSAAKNFDYTQKCRFSTYATKWIRQGIDRCVLNHGVIHVPIHTMEKIRKLLAIRNALIQETGEEASLREIADRACMPVEKAQELLSLAPQVCSLDTPAGEDGTLQQLLENLQAPQPHEELVRSELSQTLERLLSLLPERESYVLRLHFGMEDGNCLSLEQIGKRMGISKERARQLEKQGIDKLQKLGAGLGLEDFLE